MGERIPYTAFGRKLKAEMGRQGVSVRELARRMNPADPEGQRRSIARWLSPDGQRAVRPSVRSVRIAADALGVESSDLEEDDSVSDRPLTRDEQTLFFDLLSKALGVRT